MENRAEWASEGELNFKVSEPEQALRYQMPAYDSMHRVGAGCAKPGGTAGVLRLLSLQKQLGRGLFCCSPVPEDPREKPRKWPKAAERKECRP